MRDYMTDFTAPLDRRTASTLDSSRAALIWIAYGILLHAVVAANVIVALAAVGSSLLPRKMAM